MRGFVDYLALWTAINSTAWFTLWWAYDRYVSWQQEVHLLLQTSLGATAITLAVWGVTRASRSGSAVSPKYAKKAEQMLDTAIRVSEEPAPVEKKETES